MISFSSKHFLGYLLVYVLTLITIFLQKSYAENIQVITIYNGQSITLHVNVPNAVRYQWYKNEQAVKDSIYSSYTVSVSGSYTVVAFNIEGCSSLAAEPIEIKVIEDLVDLAVVKRSESRPIHVGEPFDYTLSVRNNGPKAAKNAILTDILPYKLDIISINTPTVGSAIYDPSNHTVTWILGTLDINNSTELTLTVKTDVYGPVTNTATITSKERDTDPSNNKSSDIKEILGLNITNVFTPNGDGLNDVFVIPGLMNYPENEIIIFNRWGNSVFQKKNYQNDWDGSSLNEGTYFYILKVMATNGGWQEYKGYLTLLRRALK